jgi:hypothetical protein
MKTYYIYVLFLLFIGTSSAICTYDVMCYTCLATVRFIGVEVNQYNKTIHDISETARDLCDDIGGAIVSHECDYIIDNIENVVDWLQNGTSPQIICSDLKLCA